MAVKRLLRHLYDLAHKELGALILSDEHPNIVRCFCVEEDHEFLYMALERCRGSLAAINTDEVFAAQFVEEDGRHTPYAMQVARELCEGLQALHCRGIVHRYGAAACVISSLLSLQSPCRSLYSRICRLFPHYFHRQAVLEEIMIVVCCVLCVSKTPRSPSAGT